jgi:hypothetical protein
LTPPLFQKQINWNSKERYDQFNKLARQCIFEGLAKYMAGGLYALGSYTDHEKPFNFYENMKLMLDSSYYLPKNESGGIYQHVLDYPEVKLPGLATAKGLASTRDILNLYLKRLTVKQTIANSD